MTEFLGKELVHQGTPFRSLSRLTPMAGKRAIEIGGNSNCVAALPFAEADAEVVVTGLDHVDSGMTAPHPAIRLEKADALELSSQYGIESFDLAFGVSILEHIPNPKKFFAEVARILTKGGLAFLQGAPVWTGPWGHHIELYPWYHKVKGCYQFLPAPELIAKGVDVINPIPDWGHILYKPSRLAEVLESNGIPREDIGLILDKVYGDDVVNRESAFSINQAISESGLRILDLESDRVHLPGETLAALRAVHPGVEDFSVMGLRTVLLKI